MPSALTQLPVWSAPLVPIALTATAGVVLDRFCVVPLMVSFGVTFLLILAWLIFSNTSKRTLAVIYLWCSFIGFGAVWHHWRSHQVEPRDLSRLAKEEAQPARLRGTMASAPTFQAAKVEPLRNFGIGAQTRFVLEVRQVQDLASRDWSDVSGFVQVFVSGEKRDITVGDEVELLGRLSLPGHAMNPGELDYAEFLRDQGITTTLGALSPNDVTLTRRGWPTSFLGILAVVRSWGQATLKRDLGDQHDVASVLLLGEGATMTSETWDRYIYTGVIHVLAISGQHFVVLATFLWFVARLIGVRRRHAAIAILVVLFTYALLTGGRPPVMRAAWVVTAYCVGIYLQRPMSHANTFALAWLAILLWNPTDIFSAGCQFSFLAVAVLIFGVRQWGEAPDDLQRVIDESRPWYLRALHWAGRIVISTYAINAIVWLAVTPLVAAHYHTVTPIALLIGPPMVLLTSIALLTGFLFLFVSWLAPLAWLFASCTQAAIYGCEFIAAHSQVAYFFVADVPVWWLWTLYVPLLVGMNLQVIRSHMVWALFAVAAWLAVGVALVFWPFRPGEFRCTFVAVGHGGCTVIETPNGHVVVYDAGAITGPAVTRRHIAPFLWSRGIRRIDDLILSHGDLDHFNGVPQLVERFSIGRVLSTPTFADRETGGMQKTLASLEKHGLAIEIVQRGERWEVDGVAFEALHPPAVGPTKNENARSLVLNVRHADCSLLLTGDLEDEGLTQVLAMPAPRLDVMMAPHHGSDRSNIEALAKWAKPKLVVSSQAEPISPRQSVAMYERLGAVYLGTWPNGAITIRPDAAEMVVTTFQTKKTMTLR